MKPESANNLSELRRKTEVGHQYFALCAQNSLEAFFPLHPGANTLRSSGVRTDKVLSFGLASFIEFRLLEVLYFSDEDICVLKTTDEADQVAAHLLE